MQIFSTLRTFFSSHTKKRGFTLVELLICIAIIGIVTAIVVVRYNSFDSTVLLKDTAYEIALSLREAQVRSVSVVRGIGLGESAVNYPYGMTFSPNSKVYRAFQFQNASPTANPQFNATAMTISTTTIGRTMQVYDVCITVGGTEDCSITRLDISFRRPEYKSIFFAPPYTAAQAQGAQNAKILVRSTNGGDIFAVIVSPLGQISVVKQ